MSERRPDRSTIDDSASTPDDEARASDRTIVDGATPTLADGARAEPPRLPPGTRISHFVVEHELGAGGMGVVVAAHDQLLDRKVAIKVMRRASARPGLDRGPLRLLREAQAMAKLAHPNVVTVFETGTHDGQIFIAMERIDGCTLAQWLRDQPRTARQIVDAFGHAGRGLRAAHALGMVHRDFKPENVLVGRDGQIRVTDFGLVGMAASEDGGDAPRPPLEDASLLAHGLTHTGAVLGTLRYMAPEQHAHEPVTAQSDQFAFCVALYEALYRSPPFPGATASELRARVLAGVPALPGPRRDVPRWLRPIVLRGLARRPADRWPSMAALLAALADDPAAARRRRGWALAGGVALVAAVAFGAAARPRDVPPACPSPSVRLTGVWDPPVRAEIQLAFAATGRSYAADTFTRAAGLLDRYARSWLAMRTEACEATAIRHEQSPVLLDRRMQCLDRRLSELGALTGLFRAKPDAVVVDRAVAAVLGLAPLATCGDAESLLAQVALPSDARDRAEAIALRTELARATALARAGKPKDALAEVTPLVPRARALGYAPVLAEVLMVLGTTQRDVGDPKVAEATLIEVARTAAAARDDTLVARAMIEQMWVVGYRGGRRGDALALVPYIEATVTRAGNDPLIQGGLYRYVAILLGVEGKSVEALASAQRALELVARANPEGREVANTLGTMGNIDMDRGDFAKARTAYEHAIAIDVRLYGPDHLETATLQANLAAVLLADGKLTAALAVYQTTLAVSERVDGPASLRTGRLLNNIGMVLDAQDRWREAAPINRRALAVYETALGPGHTDLVQPLSNLGDEAVAAKRWADAEAYYGRALEICEHALGNDSVVTMQPLEMMARLRLDQGKAGDALAMARRILAVRERDLEPGAQQIGHALILRGRAEVALGRLQDGLATLQRGLAVLTASPEAIAFDELGDDWLALARACRQAGHTAAAADATAKAQAAYQRLEPSARRERKLRELAAWTRPR